MTDSKGSNNRLTQKDIVTAAAGAFAEWMFAMLPIVVTMIVLANLDKFSHMNQSPEWAFGASILAGQSIARFVAGVHSAGRLSIDRVLLGISAVLVMLVVPSNIVLVLVIIGAESESRHVSDLLSVLQILLFCAASATFMLIATFAHLWTRHPGKTRRG